MSATRESKTKMANTGNLRSMLITTLEDVLAGTMEVQQAYAVVKIAAQINASLLAEAQLAKINFMSNKQIYDIGTLPLENEKYKRPQVIDN
jgi:hypothetical protein